jgi:mono/diheme cytochrome c family protein
MRQALPKLLTLVLLLAPNWSAAQATDEINTARAQANYMLNCQGCHQADGSGLPGNVPTMRGFAGRFLQVPGGREFLVQVPGSSNSPLNNAELAELLNWILLTMSPESLGKDFQYYTEEEVAEMREHVLVDVGQIRESLVASMEP